MKGSRQILEPESAGFEGARLGGIVDVVDAEALGVARCPFEVIEQRPEKVAAHIGALIDGVGDRTDVRFDVGAPLIIDDCALDEDVAVGRSVFCDV